MRVFASIVLGLFTVGAMALTADDVINYGAAMDKLARVQPLKASFQCNLPKRGSLGGAISASSFQRDLHVPSVTFFQAWDLATAGDGTSGPSLTAYANASQPDDTQNFLFFQTNLPSKGASYVWSPYQNFCQKQNFSLPLLKIQGEHTSKPTNPMVGATGDKIGVDYSYIFSQNIQIRFLSYATQDNACFPIGLVATDETYSYSNINFQQYAYFNGTTEAPEASIFQLPTYCNA